MDDQAGLVLPRSKARGLENVRKILSLIIRKKPVMENLGGGDGEKNENCQTRTESQKSFY